MDQTLLCKLLINDNDIEYFVNMVTKMSLNSMRMFIANHVLKNGVKWLLTYQSTSPTTNPLPTENRFNVNGLYGA